MFIIRSSRAHDWALDSNQIISQPKAQNISLMIDDFLLEINTTYFTEIIYIICLIKVLMSVLYMIYVSIFTMKLYVGENLLFKFIKRTESTKSKEKHKFYTISLF